MRSIILGSALAFTLSLAVPAGAMPLASGMSANDTSITQVKSKKKRMSKMGAKRQMGNDTINSSSGTATQDGGRGGGMSGTPDRTGSGTR